MDNSCIQFDQLIPKYIDVSEKDNNELWLKLNEEDEGKMDNSIINKNTHTHTHI